METIGVVIGAIGALLGLFGGLCAVIVPLLLLAGLGYLLYRRSQQSQAARAAAQSWPKTSGIVLSSSTETHQTGDSSSTVPVVVYQYKVEGKTYQNKIIKAGEKFLSVRLSGQAQATVERYPVGAKVTVYYNPAKPADSALER